jgi:ketosteroid isomerase-like protein
MDKQTLLAALPEVIAQTCDPEIETEVWGGENYIKPVEVIDLGERIVLLAHVPMRAQASGVSLTEAFAYIATVKDGRVIHLQEYFDHAEALEAAGLSEQDAHADS